MFYFAAAFGVRTRPRVALRGFHKIVRLSVLGVSAFQLHSSAAWRELR
jgi:hypothetical protein